MVPLLNEIDLLRVKGNVTFAVNTVAPTVSIKAGGSAVDDATTTFVNVSLGSYTISTIVRIGADTASMAIDAFEGWLIGKIAEQLSYKIEHYIINGDGEGEPTGIDLAFTSSAWADGTDAVDWASTSLGTVDIDKAIGLLPAAYDRNAKFLMSKKTFFQSVIGLEDVNNVPLVSREEGKYRIRGYEVIFSDQVTTGDIFYGDFKRGMVGNLSNEVQVERDRNLSYNAWDYLGWCSFDCKPSKVKAIIKIASDIA
jgi:HK97 family phage major capsid protein